MHKTICHWLLIFRKSIRSSSLKEVCMTKQHIKRYRYIKFLSLTKIMYILGKSISSNSAFRSHCWSCIRTFVFIGNHRFSLLHVSAAQTVSNKTIMSQTDQLLPFLSSNIQSYTYYGVIVSQLTQVETSTINRMGCPVLDLLRIRF